jgi:HAD superfamily hydrolase (TIGR01490 family)
VILAVFDVDGTLTRGDSLKWFAWYVFKRSGLRIYYLPGLAFCLSRYLFGFCDAAVLKAAVLRTLLCGTSVKRARQQAEQFTRDLLFNRLYPLASERLNWHRERDHRIVFLSASPDIYLNEFAGMLGADTLICTRVASRDGYLTGELAGDNCKGEEKLKRLSAELSLQGANWSESYGYGNAAEDIPFLRALGHPTAINPDRRLRQMAAERGWKVETWR